MAAWEALLAAADKQIPGYRRLVLAAAEHAGAAVNWSRVETLLEGGQHSQALALIDASWQPAISDTYQIALKQQNLAALGSGAQVGLAEVGKFATDLPAGALGGVFDAVNPRAVLWASTRSSNLIVGIATQQRDAVRQIITRATAGEFTTQKAARLIRGVVGLDPRRAAALSTFATKTYAKAGEGAKAINAANAAIAKYQQRLLRQRAEVIARTEVLTSAHEGVQEAWLAAKDKGLIGAGMVKRWIITPDDRLCPYCKQMKVDGKAIQVPFDKPFQTPLGERMVPPMHPQCRCSAGLVRGLPSTAKVTPKTTKSHLLPPLQPRPIAPPIKRSFPIARPVPPDPPEIQKLKSLGVNADGTFATKPWANAQYQDVIDQSVLNQTAQAGQQYLLGNQTIAHADLPSITSVVTSSQGGQITHATLDDVIAAIKAQQYGGVVAVKYKGKLIHVGSEKNLLSAWASGEDVKGVLTIDADQWLVDSSPLGKLSKMATTADGSIESVHLPWQTVADNPTQAIELLDDFVAAEASTATTYVDDAVEIALIKGEPGTVHAGVMKEIVTKGELDNLPMPEVALYQNEYYLVNGDPTVLAHALVNDAATIRAKVIDLDAYLEKVKPLKKVASLKDANTGAIVLKPGTFTTSPQPSLAYAKSYVNAVKGKIPTADAYDAPLSLFKIADDAMPTATQIEHALATGSWQQGLTAAKVGDSYVVTTQQGAAKLIAKWAKGVDATDVEFADWELAVADYKTKLKGWQQAAAAKKKATKAAAKLQPSATLHPDVEQYLGLNWAPSNPKYQELAEAFKKLPQAQQADTIAKGIANYLDGKFGVSVSEFDTVKQTVTQAIVDLATTPAGSVAPAPAATAPLGSLVPKFKGMIDQGGITWSVSPTKMQDAISHLNQLPKATQDALIKTLGTHGAEWGDHLAIVIKYDGAMQPIVANMAKLTDVADWKAVANEIHAFGKSFDDALATVAQTKHATTAATQAVQGATGGPFKLVQSAAAIADANEAIKFQQLPGVVQDWIAEKVSNVGGDLKWLLDDAINAYGKHAPGSTYTLVPKVQKYGFTNTVKDKLKTIPPSFQADLVDALDVNDALDVDSFVDEWVAAFAKKADDEQWLKNLFGGAPAPAPTVPAAPPAITNAPVNAKLDDIVFKKLEDAKGSNPGGLYEAKDGQRWYVKYYTDEDQGVGEVLANSIYRDLGVGAPESVAGKLADGKVAFASKFLDDTVTTIGSQPGGITAAQANQILDGFVGDVLTGNWDAVGTGLDNVVLRGSGLVTRIDQGGTFLFRAKAGRKPANLLTQITEWEGFVDANKNPYYSRVFQTAGLSSADELGKRAIEQIDRVLQLQRRYGDWDGYVKRMVPTATPAQRKALSDILTARTALLDAKRTQILDDLRALNAPPTPPPQIVRATTKDLFGTPVAGHQTVIDAVENAAKHKARGTSLAFDGGDIEGFDVRVRLVEENGKLYTELKFKLTEQGGERFRTQSALAGSLKQEKNGYIIKQEFRRGQYATITGRTNVYGGEMYTWQESAAGKKFKILHRRASQDSTRAAFVYDNQTQIWIEGKATPEQIRSIVDRMGVRMSYPSDADIAAYKENAFVRLFQTGTKNLSKAERARVLADARAKYGVTPNDLELVVGDVERPTLVFSPQAVAKIRSKTGVGWFSHGLAKTSEDDIFDILSNDQQALLSTRQRWTEGVNIDGASSGEDVHTGGADYVFTRQQSGSIPSGQSHGTIVIKPDVLRRVDWFSYAHDSYGAQNTGHSSYGHAVTRRNNLENLKNGTGGSGQETMFAHRIGFEDMEYISVETRIRQNLIRRLRAIGITHLGGRPVEQFIRATGSRW